MVDRSWTCLKDVLPSAWHLRTNWPHHSVLDSCLLNQRGVNRCQQSSFVAAEAEGLAGALQNESVHTSQDHVKNVDQTYDAFNKYGEN